MKLRRLSMAVTLLIAVGDIYALPPTVELSAMEQRVKACGACHGGDGISINTMWPNLAGQKEGYLAKQLKDFRSGARKDPLMGPMAKPLSDKDIADFAKYFSGLGAAAAPASHAAPASSPAPKP